MSLLFKWLLWNFFLNFLILIVRIFIMDLVFNLSKALIYLSNILLLRILILLKIRLHIFLKCLKYPMILIINLLLNLKKSRIGFLNKVFLLFMPLWLVSFFNVCWYLSSFLRIAIISTIHFKLFFFFSYATVTTNLSHVGYKFFKLTYIN